MDIPSEYIYSKRYDLIIAHKEELALLMTLEQGKPLKEALGEVLHLNHPLMFVGASNLKGSFGG